MVDEACLRENVWAMSGCGCGGGDDDECER